MTTILTIAIAALDLVSSVTFAIFCFVSELSFTLRATRWTRENQGKYLARKSLP